MRHWTTDDLYLAWLLGFILGNLICYCTLARPAFASAREQMRLRHEQERRMK